MATKPAKMLLWNLKQNRVEGCPLKETIEIENIFI
jgi:hypothetical protein